MFGLDFQSLFGKRTRPSSEFFSGKKENRTRDSGGSRYLVSAPPPSFSRGKKRIGHEIAAEVAPGVYSL